ncbi:transcriptional regulator [Oceanicola sp. 22II-s10i]|uniref:winged helix-turn-helix transcriptional regulator n=1 Tax=Oceanicola sp. 22II-s10i TaxID=1317116 RepID=UPI000B767484|nr:helix-turn-helix domain-containing protein [Oceanicola sp. 22II-s10i]OWU86593.1 transcriptional regulator [Oceanicola sp. 22II-s10i]
MKWKELEHETCPVARGLSVVGDRWTLLVLRDCFRGVKRFDDFQTSLGITRHVLADRLKRLEETGVLERRLYSEAPPRHEYRLTDKGRALYPILVSLVTWAEQHQPHAEAAPFVYRDRATGDLLDPILVDRITGAPIEPHRVTAGRD